MAQPALTRRKPNLDLKLSRFSFIKISSKKSLQFTAGSEIFSRAAR
jgi:hypothetical protein